MTLVSVITPTFQRPQRLWQALESAGSQCRLLFQRLSMMLLVTMGCEVIPVPENTSIMNAE